MAELGAAFLCADLGLELSPRPDHADYVGGWLAVLKHDKRFIFSAAAFAQRACDHLWSLQPAAPSVHPARPCAASPPSREPG